VKLRPWRAHSGPASGEFLRNHQDVRALHTHVRSGLCVREPSRPTVCRFLLMPYRSSRRSLSKCCRSPSTGSSHRPRKDRHTGWAARSPSSLPSDFPRAWGFAFASCGTPGIGLGGVELPLLCCVGPAACRPWHQHSQHQQANRIVSMNLVGRALRAGVPTVLPASAPTVVAGIGLSRPQRLGHIARLSFETSQLHLLPSGPTIVTRYRLLQDFGELDESSSRSEATLRESQALACGSSASSGLVPSPSITRYRVHRRLRWADAAVSAGRSAPELREQVFDHQEFIEFVRPPGPGASPRRRNQAIRPRFRQPFSRPRAAR